jgi:hypothetical protein
MNALMQALLETMISSPDLSISAQQAAAALVERIDIVRAAMHQANKSAAADLVRHRGSRELFLVPCGTRGDDLLNICVVCRQSFTRRPNSSARTCSRSCANSLGWSDPQKVQKRIANIKAEKQTAEAKARHAENNQKRWSRPGERERLSKKNKERWADPAERAKMSRGIRKAQNDPEQRQLYSEIRKRYWADPEKRRKMVDGIRRSKGSPEARALFSSLLKQRWRDPILREKYMAAVRASARRASEAAARRRSENRAAP